jgi:hypothetical protein
LTDRPVVLVPMDDGWEVAALIRQLLRALIVESTGLFCVRWLAPCVTVAAPAAWSKEQWRAIAQRSIVIAVASRGPGRTGKSPHSVLAIAQIVVYDLDGPELTEFLRTLGEMGSGMRREQRVLGVSRPHLPPFPTRAKALISEGDEPATGTLITVPPLDGGGLALSLEAWSRARGI